MSLNQYRVIGWLCLVIGWILHLKFNLPHIALLSFAVGFAAFVSIVVERLRKPNGK